MSAKKSNSTIWLFILAIIIPIAACGGTAFFVFISVPELPGALDTLAIDKLTKVIVPGSAEIQFKKAGAYAVYYETRVENDGERYFREGYPQKLNCKLKSKTTGNIIPISNNFVPGTMYETQDQERVGVLFRVFSIDQPGSHTFSCHYPDGRTEPKMVLAVGPNFIWEFFNLAAKPVLACLGGGLVFTAACGFSILIVVIALVRRRRSGNNPKDKEVEK